MLIVPIHPVLGTTTGMGSGADVTPAFNATWLGMQQGADTLHGMLLQRRGLNIEGNGLIRASMVFYHAFVFDTGNTTRASDGTLKAASPVVKLFADGSFETNGESEGCTVTRMKAGEYLIEGCMGMNSDAAWGGIDGGFDIPKDRNGQALIWLDYEVNADGSVLVKTFHREYPSAPIFARNSREGGWRLSACLSENTC
ncbi:phage tail fiber protein [Enterobacter hormaechei]|uniref:phage tail fiber protein n=1 Tax=Enterobacter hormaechei TaxID=158836 RepID=UPI00388E93A1